MGHKLSYSSYRELDLWSVSSLLGMAFSYNKRFPLVPIGSFLKRVQNPVIIQESNSYKRVRVKINNTGVVLRDVKKGSEIGTKKQTKVQTGQFVMSKIDARNGAFGIIPSELNGAVVTNDFPVFDVDESKIIPALLVLLISTREFINFAQSCSSGTTNRQRIDLNLFLNAKIPLPPLEEQKRITDRFHTNLKTAQHLLSDAEQRKVKVSRFLEEILGVPKEDKVLRSSGMLKCKAYSAIKKWGVGQVLNETLVISEKYPTFKIEALARVSSGGTPSRVNKDYYTGKIPWVKTTEVKHSVIISSEEHITESAVENSSAKVYPKGSLLIAMYGQGATRGRTAKLGIDAATNQACAVLSSINKTLIQTDYLWFFLQFQYENLRSLASGNNQPNLNAQMIKNYNVIVPPMDVQKRIVTTIEKMRAEMLSKKEQAEALRKSAIEDFEKEVFDNA